MNLQEELCMVERYNNNGLHQAIEAMEHVKILQEMNLKLLQQLHSKITLEM